MIVAANLERTFDRLYDTVILPRGPFPERLDMFQHPVGSRSGSEGRKKTFADTNIMQRGFLPSPYYFHATRLRVEILSSAEDDLAAFKAACTVNFSITNRTYFAGPISALLLEDWIRTAMSREHLEHFVDRALANGTLGVAAIGQEPVVINPQEPFCVVVRTEESFTLSHSLAFRLFIEGPKFRPVQ